MINLNSYKRLVRRKRAFVTVEAALALSIYITLLGSMMITGIHFYEQSKEIGNQKKELSDVKSLCERQRALQFMEENIGI